MRTSVYSPHVKVTVDVGSLILLGGSWGFNSGHQAWWQAPLPFVTTCNLLFWGHSEIKKPRGRVGARKLGRGTSNWLNSGLNSGHRA